VSSSRASESSELLVAAASPSAEPTQQSFDLAQAEEATPTFTEMVCNSPQQRFECVQKAAGPLGI
jgi:hypothetical protein